MPERTAFHTISWLFDRRTLPSLPFVTFPEGKRLGGHRNTAAVEAADNGNENEASRLSHRVRLPGGKGCGTFQSLMRQPGDGVILLNQFRQHPLQVSFTWVSSRDPTALTYRFVRVLWIYAGCFRAMCQTLMLSSGVVPAIEPASKTVAPD